MVERIIPCDLTSDELFRCNGVYVSAEDYDATRRRIEVLEVALSECVSVMSRSIYPKPDVSEDHPWAVLSRARALLEKSN